MKPISTALDITYSTEAGASITITASYSRVAGSSTKIDPTHHVVVVRRYQRQWTLFLLCCFSSYSFWRFCATKFGNVNSKNWRRLAITCCKINDLQVQIKFKFQMLKKHVVLKVYSANVFFVTLSLTFVLSCVLVYCFSLV